MDVIMVHRRNWQLKKYVKFNFQGMVANGTFKRKGSNNKQWIGVLGIMAQNGTLKLKIINRSIC